MSPPSSIRQKITLLLTLSGGGAVLVVCLVFAIVDHFEARRQYAREFGLQADHLGSSLHAVLMFGDARGAQQALDAIESLPHMMAARLEDARGERLAEVRRASDLEFPVERVPEQPRYAGRFLEVGRSIDHDGERLGTLILMADLSPLQARSSRLMIIVLAVFALAMVIIAAFARTIRRDITGPIESLAAASREITSQRDFRVRVESTLGGEVGQLMRGFNEMMNTVQRQDDELREARDHLEERVHARTAEMQEEISRRIAVERELIRARDAAEAATRAKADFLANMSHEIRTPLVGVIGMADLLMDSPLSAEQMDHTETLREAGDHLLTLVTDILDFTKIESNKLELEVASFSPAQVCEGVRRLFAPRAAEAGLEFDFSIDPACNGLVLGDAARLRQVLTNLVSNALKFTTEGRVVLRLEAESEARDYRTYHFEVTDTGIGIEPSQQQHIFESFTQADTSTSRQYGGTGLGLAISKRLVERMGGHLRVSSELGKGTRFWFSLTFDVTEPSTEPAVS